MSSSWVQSKLKTIIEIPRIDTTGNCDPANNLERISLIHDLEVCYYRGILSPRQINLINNWLETGLVEIGGEYDLITGLEALATISGYTDENLIRQNKDIAGGKTEQEIRHRLEELSSTLTVELDYIVRDEDANSSIV